MFRFTCKTYQTLVIQAPCFNYHPSHVHVHSYRARVKHESTSNIAQTKKVLKPFSFAHTVAVHVVVPLWLIISSPLSSLRGKKTKWCMNWRYVNFNNLIAVGVYRVVELWSDVHLQHPSYSYSCIRNHYKLYLKLIYMFAIVWFYRLTRSHACSWLVSTTNRVSGD